MGTKNEIHAMGIAEGFVAALSEREVSCRERFEELVSLIIEATDVSETIARYYADRYWDRRYLNIRREEYFSMLECRITEMKEGKNVHEHDLVEVDDAEVMA